MFADWLHAFLPDLGNASMLIPAVVRDASDGQQGHLFGLNLSRCWQLDSLAAALPGDDPAVPAMRASAAAHLAAGLPAVTGAGFITEHWLATYAYLALAGRSLSHPGMSLGATTAAWVHKGD